MCEASVVSGARRRGEGGVSSMLGDRVTVSRASANVQLTITSLCLRLSDLDSGRVIHQHEMPNIRSDEGNINNTNLNERCIYL